MHFREWKVLYFDQNFTEVCSYGSDWQHHSIGLDNGLAPNMRLAIIGRNSATVHHYISKVTMDPNRHTIRRRFDVITTLSLHRGCGWGWGWGWGWGVGRWRGGDSAQGWGQFLFFNSIPIPIPLRSIPIPIPLGWKIAIPIPIPIPFYQFQFQFQFLFINSFSIPF